MWDLLKQNKRECEAFEEDLERLCGGSLVGADVNKLLTADSLAGHGHYAACAKCRQAAEYFVESRRIFQGLEQSTPVADPWFAAKVLAAIEAREKDLAVREGLWIAVPHYAMRLAWVAAIVLLAGTTWLFEKQIPGQTSGSASEEYLFGSPTSATSQDDVLVSMAERN